MAGLVAALNGCARPEPARETDNLTSSFIRVETQSIPPDVGILEVVNRHGDLTIIGSDEDPQSVWRVEARAASDAVAQEVASEAVCKTERAGHVFRITVTLPENGRGRRCRSDFAIRVPKWVSVVSVNGFGRTHIADLDGSVDATGEHGDMTLLRVPGNVRAKTSFASLTVSNSGPAVLENRHGGIDAQDVHGALDAGTRFGALHARQIGGAARLRNYHGGVDVADVDGDCDVWTAFAPLSARNIAGKATLRNEHGTIRADETAGGVDARTSFADIDVSGGGPAFLCRNEHGSIRIRATEAVATIDAQTRFGLLELDVPDGFEPAIHAHAGFGGIESDLPVLMKPRSADPFEGVPGDKARILLRNQNGDVRIRRIQRPASNVEHPAPGTRLVVQGGGS